MNRKWLWRTLVVCAVIGGSLLGSWVHAHAATARTPVVYGTQGNAGYSDPRVKPASMSTAGGYDQIRRITWKTWGTTAVSKRAQERSCTSGTGGTCTPWARVKVTLYDIRLHRVKNLGGGYTRIRYYSRLKYVFTGGDPIWYFFTRSGKVMQWVQPACSVHGGPC